MWVISGANHTHALSLQQLIHSLDIHHPQYYIFDLGLTEEQRDAINPHEKLDFGNLPAYYDIEHDAGQYAWKPHVIQLALLKLGEDILWLDAGCVVTAPLEEESRLISEYGIYSPVSAGTWGYLTHPSTMRLLGCPPNDLPNRSGGVVGLCHDERGRRWVRQWAHLASFKECIAPMGSDRTNHRQDQSLLTALMMQLPKHVLLCKRFNALHNVQIHRDID
jgi:hypothetical protein